MDILRETRFLEGCGGLREGRGAGEGRKEGGGERGVEVEMDRWAWRERQREWGRKGMKRRIVYG